MASIQKRANGKYLVRWRNEENKERSKQFDLMRDARRYAAQIETEMARGTYVDPRAGDITLREFYDDWKQRQLWSENTRRNSERAMQRADFADMPLNKIRRSHIESWVKGMSSAYMPNTTRTHFQLVSSVFRGAVTDGVLADNPASGVRLPKRDAPESSMTIPTPDEVGSTIDAADEWFQAYIALCAFAGLRRGEACGIQLPDIDFLGKTIRVDRQIQHPRNKKPVVVDPKRGSKRTVPVPEDLIVMLSEHVKNVGVAGEEQWLFPGKHGPLSPSSAYARWVRTTERASVEGVTLHDLRHFFASGLIAAGCDVVTVQRAMGHRSASMTLDVYSHLWPDAADRTRDAVSGLIQDSFGAREDQVRTKTQSART
jgi:integrase